MVVLLRGLYDNSNQGFAEEFLLSQLFLVLELIVVIGGGIWPVRAGCLFVLWKKSAHCVISPVQG